MRLLSFNIDSKIMKRIEEDELYIIDKASDFEDARYHLEVRFYNLVLVYENDFKKCDHLLKSFFNTSTAFVVLTDNTDVKFEIKCLNNGAIDVLNVSSDIELIMAKLEAIHRTNFSKYIFFNDYIYLDNDEKKVFDTKNNEISIRGKSYELLRYLIQNRYRPPISKDELLDALWDEPELVNPNIIEVNINNIRSKIKKEFQVNLIETVRNRGYRISA